MEGGGGGGDNDSVVSGSVGSRSVTGSMLNGRIFDLGGGGRSSPSTLPGVRSTGGGGGSLTSTPPLNRGGGGGGGGAWDFLPGGGFVPNPSPLSMGQQFGDAASSVGVGASDMDDDDGMVGGGGGGVDVPGGGGGGGGGRIREMRGTAAGIRWPGSRLTDGRGGS